MYDNPYYLSMMAALELFSIGAIMLILPMPLWAMGILLAGLLQAIGLWLDNRVCSQAAVMKRVRATMHTRNVLVIDGEDMRLI